MRFENTGIPGLVVVRLERHVDERGSFARLFSRDEFAANGLAADYVQQSISVTRKAGTVRGMHFQRQPHAEAKFVRCVRGAIHDVVVDLRPESPAFLRWLAFRLSPLHDAALHIPPGCAHGFQALEDDCELLYQMDTPHQPDFADGFRHDDPRVGIQWPLAVTMIAGKDLRWPPLANRPRPLDEPPAPPRDADA